VTLNTSFLGVIYHACSSTSQHQSEMPSFTHSKDMTGAQKFKNESRDSEHAFLGSSLSSQS